MDVCRRLPSQVSERAPCQDHEYSDASGKDPSLRNNPAPKGYQRCPESFVPSSMSTAHDMRLLASPSFAFALPMLPFAIMVASLYHSTRNLHCTLGIIPTATMQMRIRMWCVESIQVDECVDTHAPSNRGPPLDPSPLRRPHDAIIINLTIQTLNFVAEDVFGGRRCRTMSPTTRRGPRAQSGILSVAR